MSIFPSFSTSTLNIYPVQPNMGLYLPYAVPSFHVLILPLILVLLILFILKLRNKARGALKLPPGPFHLPILGGLHLIDRTLPHRSLWVLSRKHGPLMHFQLGLRPTVIVSSAKIASEIFKYHDHVFSRRPSLVSNKTLSYDFLDVAFSPHNGEYWKDMRKLMVRELLNAKTVLSFRSVREEEVARMISSIHTSPSEPINLNKTLITLTNNIVCITAFGRSYMQERSEHEKDKLHETIAEGAFVLGRFFVEDSLPWMWWIDVIGGFYAKLRKSSQDLDKFYNQVIEDHLDPKRQKPDREDFVDVLLRVQKECHLTRDHIKGIMMNILFGATETNAAVVSWGMLELMRNSRAMKKCQEEVRRIVGNKGKVDENDLSQLQYLKSVVKEIMRLHPPAPLLLPRECMQHCKINGYDILPGTALIFNAWAIGRDTEAWENPQSFFPERFMNSLIDYKGHDFELIPFGVGRRGCPGFHFATPTIMLTLASLLYCFDWEVPAGTNMEDMDATERSAVVTLPRSVLLVPTRHDFASLG